MDNNYILLCETTKDKYFSVLAYDNADSVPIIFAHRIYKFLYKIISKRKYWVSKILIIDSTKIGIKDLFEKNLKDYSPEMANYAGTELFVNIGYEFPEADLLQAEDLKDEIVSLLQRAEIISPEEILNYLKNEPALTFLPMASNTIEKFILDNNKYPIEIFTSKEHSQINHGNDFIKIDSKLYKFVGNKLKEIRDRYIQPNSEIRKYFVLPHFIKAIGEKFEKELNEIKNDEKRKIYFRGKDYYIAIRGIEDLVVSEVPMYYDLSRHTIPKKLHRDESVVILRLEKYLNRDKVKDLFGLLKDRKNKYTILQGKPSELYNYFLEYHTLELPEEEKLKDSYTSVFLSLLKEKIKFKGQEADLYSIEENKLFNELLSEVDDLESVSRVLDKTGKLTLIDLRYNTAFWCVFLEKIKEKKAELEIEKPEKIYVRLEKTTSGWDFYYGDKSSREQIKINAIKYLIILLAYCKKEKRSITVNLLRELTIIYDKEGDWKSTLTELVSMEDIYQRTDKTRKTCSERFSALKSKDEVCKDFINEQIIYSNESYYLKDADSFDLDIIDPDFDLDEIRSTHTQLTRKKK